jgi:SAM-dependent methyltransferase
MKDCGVNTEIWKDLYAQGKNDLRYPNEVLVRMASRMLNPESHPRILDFGFGTGANLIHFARGGFSVSGVEISNHAIEQTKMRLDKEGLSAELKLLDPNSHLPYEDSCFDAVIAWQVLYYNNWETISTTVVELERVLRSGGIFIGTMAAPGDISQVLAEPLGDGVYRSRVPGQEGCIVLIPEVEMLQRVFPNKIIETGEFFYRYGNTTSRHFIVTYQKS